MKSKTRSSLENPCDGFQSSVQNPGGITKSSSFSNPNSISLWIKFCNCSSSNANAIVMVVEIAECFVFYKISVEEKAVTFSAR
ncbi:hypothetical protein EV2_013759 [Malus domestica]